MSQSLSRRQFLKAGGATAAGVAVSPLVHAKEAPPATDPGATVLPYPRQSLGSVGKLAVNSPVDFTFPDESSPCVLVKMGHAVPGGVLGHQVGGGRGKDVATAGGAVAGAAIGANAGRNNGGTYERDVRRCETTASGPPDYWDVTYTFRGTEHRLQMSAPPGRTIAVNQNGEPRQ